MVMREIINHDNKWLDDVNIDYDYDAYHMINP